MDGIECPCRIVTLRSRPKYWLFYFMPFCFSWVSCRSGSLLSYHRIYYLLTQPVVEDGEIEEENTLLDQSSHSYSEPHQLDGEEYKQDLISKKVGNGRKGRKSRDYFHLNPNVSCPHCALFRLLWYLGGYQNNRNAVVCLKCNNMLGQ